MSINLRKANSLAVFGSGTIAARCVKLLRDMVDAEIYVYEKKQSNVSILERSLSHIAGVHYGEVGEGLEAEILEVNPAVIFSINNVYLFPGSLAERVPILNYHNSLLPKHPGRNAEAWTIFSQDQTAGVTWHFVDAHVDTGNIVAQKEILLSPHITSIRLLSLQTQTAFNMFQEILNDLCRGEELPRRKQEERKDIKFHFSWERPNDGMLSLSWDISQTYAFLRAMDYGKLALLGIPLLEYDGIRYSWERYALEPTPGDAAFSLDLLHDTCTISRDGESVRLFGLKQDTSQKCDQEKGEESAMFDMQELLAQKEGRKEGRKGGIISQS